MFATLNLAEDVGSHKQRQLRRATQAARPGAVHNCPALPQAAAKPIVSLEHALKLRNEIQAKHSPAGESK